MLILCVNIAEYLSDEFCTTNMTMHSTVSTTRAFKQGTTGVSISFICIDKLVVVACDFITGSWNVLTFDCRTFLVDFTCVFGIVFNGFGCF